MPFQVHVHGPTGSYRQDNDLKNKKYLPPEAKTGQFVGLSISYPASFETSFSSSHTQE
jgi:hypothetical protein